MTRLDHPTKLAARARHYRLLGQDDIAERLESALVGAGRCRRCGRILTHPESVEHGIGPECATKENQP